MIFIDTSVAAKWIFEEDYRDHAIKLLRSHKDGTSPIYIPDLFYYEIANTLATKSEFSIKDINESLELIHLSNLHCIHPTYKDIRNATEQAHKYKTSVYDMIYAVLAKENKADLVTADEKFIKKTGFSFVKHIGEV